MGFTPGPWRIETRSGSQVIEADDRDNWICWAGYVDADDPPSIGNARLISAAPDLLEVCVGLLGLLQLIGSRSDVCDDIRHATTNNHRVLAAQAAIAKARGVLPTPIEPDGYTTPDDALVSRPLEPTDREPLR